jgi:hypothetical protein
MTPWIGRCETGGCPFETGNSDVLAAHKRNVHGIGKPYFPPRPSPPSPARVPSQGPANALGRAPGLNRPGVSPKSASGLLAQQRTSVHRDYVRLDRRALQELLRSLRARGWGVTQLASVLGVSVRTVNRYLTLDEASLKSGGGE